MAVGCGRGHLGTPDTAEGAEGKAVTPPWGTRGKAAAASPRPRRWWRADGCTFWSCAAVVVADGRTMGEDVTGAVAAAGGEDGH